MRSQWWGVRLASKARHLTVMTREWSLISIWLNNRWTLVKQSFVEKSSLLIDNNWQSIRLESKYKISLNFNHFLSFDSKRPKIYCSLPLRPVLSTDGTDGTDGPRHRFLPIVKRLEDRRTEIASKLKSKTSDVRRRKVMSSVNNCRSDPMIIVSALNLLSLRALSHFLCASLHFSSLSFRSLVSHIWW